MTTQTRPVNAIECGTVIDHIQTGQGLKVIQLLNGSDQSQQMTLGLNFKSEAYTRKDLIKIEERVLTYEEASYIAILSPHVTVSIIRDYQIARKFKPKAPDFVRGTFSCSNPNCITKTEDILHAFYVSSLYEQTKLTCKYCEKTFSQQSILLKYDPIS